MEIGEESAGLLFGDTIFASGWIPKLPTGHTFFAPVPLSRRVYFLFFLPSVFAELSAVFAGNGLDSNSGNDGGQGGIGSGVLDVFFIILFKQFHKLLILFLPFL